jgi:hypothetical protein
MSAHEFRYDLNEFQPRPPSRRWWPKALAVCAAVGGTYGAALGAVLGTTAGAVDVIGTAAGIVALLCGIPGARFGLFFSMLNRVRHARLFVSMFAVTGGAILGGYLGLMAVTPLGVVILGALGGWLFAREILGRGLLKRALGLVLGVCVAAMVMALRRDQAAALVGMAWGVGLGAMIGSLLFLLFIGTPPLLPAAQESDQGNYIDATFQK